MVRMILGAVVLTMLLGTGCKKEDKKAEVVDKLIGTWERQPTAKWSNDSTFTFTENATLILDGSGDFTYIETSFDSTSQTTIESSWDVNQAGTTVELSLFEDYEIVLLSDTSLVWDYDRLDGIKVTETYLRQ